MGHQVTSTRQGYCLIEYKESPAIEIRLGIFDGQVLRRAARIPRPVSGSGPSRPTPLPLSFRSFGCLCPGFRGLVTVWLHVDSGGVMGHGGP